MIGWAVTFLIVALVAAVLGFTESQASRRKSPGSCSSSG